MKNIVANAHNYIELERDKTFRDEVKLLLEQNNTRELKERFSQELAFGTGGLRGIVAGGSNCMNPYTVGRATQGVAQYILRAAQNKASIVIAYDSRHYSLLFAEVCAEVCVAHDIHVFFFKTPHPTPVLSFAVRQLKASAGIMITASHNPPEYNGYKAYWNDGAQLIAPHDANIIEEIKNITHVKRTPFKEALKNAHITYVEQDIDQKYCEYVDSLTLNKELIRNRSADIAITYTPLHGVGADLFQRLCSRFGYSCRMVAEQMEPNGDFPTVQSPNPENPAAFKMALAQAKQNASDVVIANDPDADRVAIAVHHEQEFVILSGNQVGALIIDYVLQQRTALGTLPAAGAVIKTVVTTELQRKICERYGVHCYDTLTGFKHIAAKIKELEEQKDGTEFIVGGEESIGYMYGSEVRDKDGINIAMLILEMTLYHKTHGRTLCDVLNALYNVHGYFEEKTISKVFRGLSGIVRIEKIMQKLRDTPPEIIATIAVEKIIDYQKQTVAYCATHIAKPLVGFPVSNVLQFVLTDGSVVSVRPSGTEPKIKFYASCSFTPQVDMEQAQIITHGMIQEIEILIDEWSKKQS